MSKTFNIVKYQQIMVNGMLQLRPHQPGTYLFRVKTGADWPYTFQQVRYKWFNLFGPLVFGHENSPVTKWADECWLIPQKYEPISQCKDWWKIETAYFKKHERMASATAS